MTDSKKILQQFRGGTRKASASLEDLVTVYASFPLNVGTDLYGKIGYHMVEVTTSETVNASYGNDDITGYQLAVGKIMEILKVKFSF